MQSDVGSPAQLQDLPAKIARDWKRDWKGTVAGCVGAVLGMMLYIAFVKPLSPYTHLNCWMRFFITISVAGTISFAYKWLVRRDLRWYENGIQSLILGLLIGWVNF